MELEILKTVARSLGWHLSSLHHQQILPISSARSDETRLSYFLEFAAIPKLEKLKSISFWPARRFNLI
jgi:hypothetical protein